MSPEEALRRLGACGVFSVIHGPEHDFPGIPNKQNLRIFGGSIRVPFASGYVYDDFFTICQDTATSPFVARVPEPGQVGTESEHTTLEAAVGWVIERRPSKKA